MVDPTTRMRLTFFEEVALLLLYVHTAFVNGQKPHTS